MDTSDSLMLANEEDNRFGYKAHYESSVRQRDSLTYFPTD